MQNLPNNAVLLAYWDTWDVVINNAVLTDESGQSFYLWQDGDLWAVPTDFTFEEGDS